MSRQRDLWRSPSAFDGRRLGDRLLLALAASGLLHLTLNAPLYLFDASPGWRRPALGLVVATAFTTPLVAAAFTTRVGILLGAITFVGCGSLSLANAIKLMARAEPILPSDLAFLPESKRLTGYASWPDWSNWIAVLAGVLAGLLVCAVSWRRLGSLDWRSKLVIGFLALSSCYSFTTFLSGTGPLSAALRVGNYTAPVGAPTLLYEHFGLALGALTMYSPHDPILDYQPQYFGDSAAAQDFLRSLAGPSLQVDAKPNVVVILSESLTDPSSLPNVTVPGDLFESLDPYMATGARGTLQATAIGGGTGDMEYQVLSGLPLAALSEGGRPPMVRAVAPRERFSSFVETFKRLDYLTHAAHPYSESLYSRKSAYQSLGFDESRFEESFPEGVDRNGEGYILDSEVYDELVVRLEESARPVFANVVTMQNHVPWGDAWDKTEVVGGIDDAERLDALANYAHGLRVTAEATAALLRDLGELDERTVVIVYGDHLPSLYPQRLLSAAGQLAYSTPLFLFDTGRDMDGASLGELLPTQVLPVAMQLSGLPMPPIAAGLSQLDGTGSASDSTAQLQDARIAEALWWLTKEQVTNGDVERSYDAGR